MLSSCHRLLAWISRSTGIALAAFMALFALDAFDGLPLGAAIPEFLIHLLPAAVVLAIVAIAWRRPWVGAGAFMALAIAYATAVAAHPDWVVAISGPLVLAAVLFALTAFGAPRLGDRASS